MESRSSLSCRACSSGVKGVGISGSFLFRLAPALPFLLFALLFFEARWMKSLILDSNPMPNLGMYFSGVKYSILPCWFTPKRLSRGGTSCLPSSSALVATRLLSDLGSSLPECSSRSQTDTIRISAPTLHAALPAFPVPLVFPLDRRAIW